MVCLCDTCLPVAQASRELEAVTQLHTLTNSHRSVKVIKKPRSAHTKHITGT